MWVGLLGDQVSTLRVRVRAVRAAVGDLLDQEFGYSTGHLAAVLNTCLFAPSLLTFWFVNGVVDFSTAIAIGAVAGPAGLQVRLVAYLLLVPTFLVARMTVHLAHPVHRRQVLAGSCPNVQLLSLDWFSVGILATGLPLAVQDLGPWLGTNLVFLFGLFVVPRFVAPARRGSIKIGTIVIGSAFFLYASYGAAVPGLPAPSAVLGPAATLRLSDATVAGLLRVVTSVTIGPVAVGLFAVFMNHLLTRPELTDIPVLRHSLPRRDPDRVVLLSGSLGTAFYLLVVAVWSGHIVVVP